MKPVLSAYFGLMRPRQWVKNGFVLVGLVFGHGFTDPALVARAVLLLVAFCLSSSGVYAMNDVLDRQADRAHPKKRDRPVASGAIPAAHALAFALALAGAGLALAYHVSPWASGLAACYLAVNLGYSGGLKHMAVLDVLLIASGFMLRILAGTTGLGIAPSHWLLFCGLTLTVFLGFAKRRAELQALQEAPSAAGAPQRPALEGYSAPMLDRMILLCAVATVLAYTLYTLDAETAATHGTDALVYTVPFVMYGVSRYRYMLYHQGGGADPAAQLLGDPHLLLATAGWLAVVVWLIA